MITMQFSVADRFGNSLSKALLEVKVTAPNGTRLGEGRSSSQADGSGTIVLDIGRFYPMGNNLVFDYRVTWIDADGVVWGHGGATKWQVVQTPDRKGFRVAAQVQFGLTSRVFPQEPLPPEIETSTRQNVLRLRDGAILIHTSEESRDALIAGLPNSSAVQSGKTLETAFILRGRIKGWPLEEWEKTRGRPLMLGDYFQQPEIKQDLSSSFSPGFLKLMAGANDARILGAHQTFERVSMPDARAIQNNLTKLLNGWFGSDAIR